MLRKWMILLCVLMLGISGAAAQEAATELRVFMPFIPNIQFAPVYVAIEQGYFAEEGLSVSLEYGAEPDGLELIAAGEIDYGFISGEQVIVARANERPVVYVYEWYQQNPIAVMVAQTDAESDEGLDVETVLTSQRLGIPGRFGATYASFVALLDHFELAESDVMIEEIGFNAPEVVCVGGVSAAAVYINNEPLQVRNRALADDCGDVTGVEVIPVSDYVDLVSNGIVTSEARIAGNPDEVAGFVRAFERGLIDSIQNPHMAYMLSVPHIEGLPFENADVFADLSMATTAFLQTEPTAAEIADRRDFLIAQSRTVLTPEELLQFEVLLETIALWDVEQLGLSLLESWEVTQAALQTVGFIEAGIDLDAAFTNDFLPGQG